MYCPKCRAEYRPGFNRCSDCDVDLVDVLAVRANPPSKWAVRSSSKGDETIATGFGWLVLIVLGCAVIWAAWNSAFDCLLADKFDYVTKECALTHLIKPACNAEQDIFEVDEVTDSSYTDNNGKRQELRTVIYEFRKRPISGPVSDAVMRDTSTLFKLQNGEWAASCENAAADKSR